MNRLTSLERVKNTLNFKPVDRLALAIDPWPATEMRWKDEGHIGADVEIREHFGQDLRYGGWLNFIADLDHKDVILEETETTALTLDGNGAILRRRKDKTGTPEHVDYKVKDRAAWEELIKPHLLEVDRRRINFEEYRKERNLAKERQQYFCWHIAGHFENMIGVSGHENILMGMALDPDWAKDMVNTFVNSMINHAEVLFAEEGRPDGHYYADDLGFKGKPFMSPAMFRDIMFPGYKKLYDFGHSIGCKVLLHSCGFMEPLLPALIEAGLDCLQAMEVKAGMDMPHLFEKFGDRIAFFGGIDVRTLISNDLKQVEEELLKKIPPVVNNGGGYILHTDHSEPPEINYETMAYFIKRGLEIGAGKI